MFHLAASGSSERLNVEILTGVHRVRIRNASLSQTGSLQMAAHHMTRDQKQMARSLKAKGLTLKAIARELSVADAGSWVAARPPNGRS
jgi:hypothetical protein